MINFCHISPTKYLEKLTKYNRSHLVLAHLVEEDPLYADFYANLNDGKYLIMDNSAFEMFKQNKPMYEPSKLIDMGTKVNANCIVLPDYPMQDYKVTIEAGKNKMGIFKDAGFQSFFVPQSELGDLSGYLKSVEWALGQKEIDLIGLSILGCPIALGLNEQTGAERDDSYKMQRFLSRWSILNILEKEGMLGEESNKRFHLLGMVDGPNEINLVRHYHNNIFSWDSSAAIWAGLNNIEFDNSPTGLRYGKYEVEVDFNKNTADNESIVKAINNINYINGLCSHD